LKEQILYLDPLDDFHSMRDKIGWVQADRVLLVLPQPRAGRRPFKRQLDVLLIQRHAAKLGAKLALVTDDPVVCDFADALGIQVFDAVDDSHLQPWRSRRPAPPRRQPRPKPDPDDAVPLLTLPRIKFLESPRLRLAAGAFTFFNIVAAITVMLALTLPGAQIVITPQTQNLTAQAAIVADPAQTEIDAVNGLIPARTVTTIVSGAIEVATTGSVDKATQKSGGEVTFTNLTNLEVRIPAGAAVRTTGGSPIRFITQTEVALAAKKGSTGIAFVLAEEPGPLGNVGAGLINSVEGPLAVQAAVTNESAATGGEVQQVASVTEADRERAAETLTANLRQQGFADLVNQLDEGEFAPLDSLTVTRVLDRAYDHFAGEEAERLKLEMRLEVGATAVDEAQAFAVGQAALERQLGDTLALLPDTVTFTREPLATVGAEGSVRFNISAEGRARAAIDPEDVRNTARWQLAEQTPNALLAQFPLVAPPEVSVWPGWFPRLPWLAWRIDVRITPDER
jgi:hypothetical protein